MKKLLIAICLLFAALPAMAATCAIEEFTIPAIDDDGAKINVPGAPVATQSVTHTVTTQSAAFATGVRYIRVICDEKTFFALGASPTATTASAWIAADTAMDRGVNPGDKIAFCDADCL